MGKEEVCISLSLGSVPLCRKKGRNIGSSGFRCLTAGAGVVSALALAGEPSTADRDTWEVPTRGAVAWLTSAIEMLDVASAGVVELPSLRELARLTGRSPGTVHEHVRRLGPRVVLSTVPLRLNLDAIERIGVCDRAPAGSRARAARLGGVSTGRAGLPTTGAAGGDDLVRGLLAVVKDLVRVLEEAVAPGPSAVEDPRQSTRGGTAQSARRAVVARSSLRRATTARSSQTVSQISSSTFLSSERTARSVARRPGDDRAVVTSPAEVQAALRPLVEFCRRCSPPLPSRLDQTGVHALQRFDAAALRAAALQVKQLAAEGVARRPLGLLVSKARSDPGFFGNEVEDPVMGVADVPVNAVADDAAAEPSPIRLSAAQEAVVEEELARRVGSSDESPARAGMRLLLAAKVAGRGAVR